MLENYEFKSVLALAWARRREEQARLLGRQEGKQEGHQEGWQEGHQESTRRLLRQLAKRFGALPAWVEPLVMAAPPEDLDRWAEDIFDATTLEGLLGRVS